MATGLVGNRVSEQLAQARVLRSLTNDVLLPAYNPAPRTCDAQRHAADQQGTDVTKREGRDRRFNQHRRVLAALLEYLDMDVTATGGMPAEGVNWLGIVHDRVAALVPPAVWRLYASDGIPSEDGLAVLAALSPDGGPLMEPYRNRGLMHFSLSLLTKLIIRPLNHLASFAVPNERALVLLSEVAPLIECGAGTGYWSALLKARGVDIVAYDAQPPTAEHNNG